MLQHNTYVYLGVTGNLMDRTRHLTCHLITCPIFSAALFYSILSIITEHGVYKI